MNTKLNLLCPLLALLLAAGCAQPKSTITAPPVASSLEAGVQNSAAQQPNTRMRCLFYDSSQLEGGIQNAPLYQAEGDLTSGMIPHHLLAADMIAGFFELAAEQQPYDAVLIVSPSHFGQNCQSMVTTATKGWQTPFGLIDVDEELARALLDNTTIAAEDNPNAVELDHGGAGLVPLVARYLPDTPVTVCLLSNRLSRERLEAVRQVIAQLRQERRILLVVSADCSHYLQPQEAHRRDEDTISAIEGLDLEKILSYTDANIDSPQAVSLLLDAAGEADTTLTLLDHSASNSKLPHGPQNPIYFEGVTSYLVYAVTKNTP
ncbi:MAG: AmmeMemoRadiSam system protein B [Angelakisella sp.]|nr:AmmeMemoRadiSam system protein B [Angelakisella sp.]